MPLSYKPRLCGGMLFTILCEAKERRVSVRQRMDGKNDGLSNTNMFFEFIKIVQPNFKMPAGDSFKNNASRYKSCTLSTGSYLPFDEEATIESFTSLVENDYFNALKRLLPFIRKFIRIRENETCQVLFGRLIGLIESDDSISNEQLFIIDENKWMTKSELVSQKKIVVENFLLAVLHYIIKNKIDNTVGQETYENTHPQVKEKGAIRKGSYSFSNKQIREVAFLSIDDTDIRFDEKEKENFPVAENVSEPDNKRFINKYLNSLHKKYSKMKTLLYTEEPHEFKDFYVCNNIALHCAADEMEQWFPETLPDFIVPRDADVIESLDQLVLEPAFEEVPTLLFSERSMIENATSFKLLKEYSNFIIITGTGGLGKSMMMRHFLLDAIDNYEKYKMLPIFIPLKDYTENYKSLYEFVYKRFSSTFQTSKEVFNEKLRNGELLFLFDGLDEISSKNLPNFEREIETFCDRFSTNMFIISSRPYSSFVSFTRFTILKVMPLTKSQALKLISRLDLGKDGEQVKTKFQKEIKSKLYNTHRDFVTNPLLLTIMLITFEQYAEIPSKMHVFYREAFSALAQKHDATKGAYKREFKTGLSADRFSDYFAEFCSRTYHDEKVDFNKNEIDRYFHKLKELEKDKNNPDVNVSNFIDDLVSGLCLMYYEGNEYHFTHRSFQEYFCALYFSKQKDKNLGAIGEFFEKNGKKLFNDSTFPMLYDMIPEKVEEYIFLPFIENLLKQCDEKNGYQTFLSILYPEINYEIGETFGAEPVIPNSLTYKLIRKMLMGKSFIFLRDCLPFHRLNISGAYTKLETMTNGKKVLELTDLSTLYDENGKNPSIDEFELAGSTHYFLVDEIYDKCTGDIYKELIEALENDNFILKKEYNLLRQYYESAKEDTTPSGDDLFDRF